MSHHELESDSETGLDAAPAGSAEPQEGLLAGRRVAFVGKLGGLSRKAAMQLVRGHGGQASDSPTPETDLVVIGAEESPLAEAELLEERVRDAAGRGEIEVIHETEFWERLGLVEVEQAVKRLYTPAMLADLLGVSVRVIRRWHRRGLVVPVRTVHHLPYFDFQEVATARRLAELVAAGASAEAIERKLVQLAQIVPDVQRPLAQLNVLVEGKQILLRQGEGLLEPGGQMRIDFDAFAGGTSAEASLPDPAILSFQGRAAPAFPSEGTDGDDALLAQAYALEDAGNPAAAIDYYHALLARDGARPDLCFQLGELLYRIGEVTAARERYYAAIELDEEFVEARASLGCVLAETGQKELAVAAFRGTLELHDDYPDVHYNLARTLDDLGRSDEATPHWERFLELAPSSPWADEAHCRLGVE